MELTVDQALQKGIEAQKAGKLQEADKYYTAILKVNPKHPDANHNMGLLAVGFGKIQAALPFFKTATEVNPKIAQFWISYIDAFIKLDRIDDADQEINQARSKGIASDAFAQLEERLGSARLKNIEILSPQSPPKKQIQKLINLHSQGKYQEALNEASQLLKKFPKSAILHNINGAAKQGLGKLDDAIEAFGKALSIKPDYSIYSNMGNTLKDLGKLEQALEAYTKAISYKPNFAEANYAIGVTLQRLGRLDEALEAYKKAVSIKPNYAEAYNNIGVTLKEKGKLKEAIKAYTKAINIKPDYADAYWNLSGTAENIDEAKLWIEKCIGVDPSHLKAKLTRSALLFYEGDKSEFNKLSNSPLKDDAYMRSFAWVFKLPDLPALHFHRWAFFDDMTSLSKKDRPFYEFGVWRGEAFRYLIKTFKKGYGFDTFEGLPENWHNKKAGTYSSDGNVPKIKGGEFIVGKFEDTLPDFFAEARPKASIINFDADLYSSTICALNFSKPVIDRHTILIFDEFIMNENWAQDEYKALEEFCAKNYWAYEVLAVSFYTKQVAVRLIGI